MNAIVKESLAGELVRRHSKTFVGRGQVGAHFRGTPDYSYPTGREDMREVYQFGDAVVEALKRNFTDNFYYKELGKKGPDEVPWVVVNVLGHDVPFWRSPKGVVHVEIEKWFGKYFDDIRRKHYLYHQDIELFI